MANATRWTESQMPPSLPVSPVAAAETRLLDGRVVCFQPVKGYRSAIDPVLMQAAVPASPGARVLELGCGVGSAALCLACRLRETSVTGLDIQAPLIDLARKGAAANSVDGRVRFVAGDLLSPPAEVAEGGFDHVMANPPFQKEGTSRPSPDPVKAAATVEGSAKLVDWVSAAAASIREGGTVTFIHHAGRTDELASLMADCLGAVRVQPFVAREGDVSPVRVLVQGTKGAAAGSRTFLPVILHQADGAYRADVDRVLRGQAVLKMSEGGGISED